MPALVSLDCCVPVILDDHLPGGGIAAHIYELRLRRSQPSDRCETEAFPKTPSKLFHQQGRAAALDFAGYPAVEMGRHPGDAPRENLPALTDEFSQKIGVLVIDRLDGDIDPSPRHGAISAAKSGTTLGGLWLHVTSSPGATCAAAKTGCTSSFPID